MLENKQEIFCNCNVFTKGHSLPLEIEHEVQHYRADHIFSYVIMGDFVPEEGLGSKKNPYIRQRVWHKNKNYNDYKPL